MYCKTKITQCPRIANPESERRKIAAKSCNKKKEYFEKLKNTYTRNLVHEKLINNESGKSIKLR